MKKYLSNIIDLMRERFNTDLISYDQEFLMKILENRQKSTNSTTGEAYLNLLLDGAEAERLQEALHISYTSFFREPLTFAILEQIILPTVMANKNKGSQIRIWSAGCAGGREAYSVAMILSDLLESSGKGLTYRIFATDISEKALEEGRAGIYHESLVQEVKLKHLHKYFIVDGKNYLMKRDIRDFVDFFKYDMLDTETINPPESIYGDFDLVICSNLLIYYRPLVQREIINKLKRSISDSGYLITGESEKRLFQHHKELQMVVAPNSIFKIDRRRG